MNVTQQSDNYLLEHYERWLGDTQRGALAIALGARLEGIEVAQATADVWFSMTYGLLKRDRRRKQLETYPVLQKWAKQICARRSWLEHAKSIDGLCFSLAHELMDILLVEAIRENRTESKCGNADKRLYDRLRRSVPRHAFRALDSIANDFGWPHLQWKVVAPAVPPTVIVKVIGSGETVCTVDEMRVRPHTLRAEHISGAPLNPSEYQIAQTVSEFDEGGMVCPSEMDTIDADHPDLPFWPRASTSAEYRSSYRCAVHARGAALEWSDWPQIALHPTGPFPHLWKFHTSVFRKTHHSGTWIYEMVGDSRWQIDWNRNCQDERTPPS